MNFTDRTYLAVHLVLALLVCVRPDRVAHWPAFLIWNLVSSAVIVLLARRQDNGAGWQFAHDWLPAVFFITVFEQVSFLSLSLREGWQNQYVIAFEQRLFGAVPMEWLHAHARSWMPEFLEFGYFAFYLLYPVVGGMLWARRSRASFAGAFRRMTDTLSVGYVLCYATYLGFPTQSPANRAGVQQIGSAHGGIFQQLVRTIQNHAGVHGNAFPSAHIMLAFVVLMFTYQYVPRLAPWILGTNLLMCVGAAYDGYHYASDVFVGAVMGIVLGAVALRVPGIPSVAKRSRGTPTPAGSG